MLTYLTSKTKEQLYNSIKFIEQTKTSNKEFEYWKFMKIVYDSGNELEVDIPIAQINCFWKINNNSINVCINNKSSYFWLDILTAVVLFIVSIIFAIIIKASVLTYILVWFPILILALGFIFGSKYLAAKIILNRLMKVLL